MSSFDLSKPVDTSKSISFNYTHIELNTIRYNVDTNDISAICEHTSSSNVTITENNIKSQFRATEVYIVGIDRDPTSINQISGVDHGQLIIKNVDIANGTDILYMCFPLVVTVPGPDNSGIDALIQAGVSTTQTLSADFNAAIFAKDIPEVKYVEYTSSTLGTGARVVTFAHPISIRSPELHAMKYNKAFFDIQPKDYSILIPSTPGEWMECDYVPIDSEEVETYNLPVTSSLVQDSAAHNSLKTMFMYILFLLFTGLSYSIIPAIYQYLLSFLFVIFDTNGYSARTAFMGKFDAVMKVLLLALIIMFFWMGQQFILYGIVISIVTLLGYIIISSKKSNDTKDDFWPINEIEKDEAK
jgi:hypothetical protein